MFSVVHFLQTTDRHRYTQIDIAISLKNNTLSCRPTLNLFEGSGEILFLQANERSLGVARDDIVYYIRVYLCPSVVKILTRRALRTRSLFIDIFLCVETVASFCAAIALTVK